MQYVKEKVKIFCINENPKYITFMLTILQINWTQEAVLFLIEEWKNHECLYDTKDKFYKNKHKRFDALNQIAENMKTFDANIDSNAVMVRNQ